MPKYCTKCWTSNPDNAFSCSNCNHILQSDTGATTGIIGESQSTTPHSPNRTYQEQNPSHGFGENKKTEQNMADFRDQLGSEQHVTENPPRTTSFGTQPLKEEAKQKEEDNNQHSSNKNYRKEQSQISPEMMEILLKKKNQSPFFWVVTIILSTFGMLKILRVFTGTETYQQEIAGATVAIAMAVVPYVLAKAIKELNS